MSSKHPIIAITGSSVHGLPPPQTLFVIFSRNLNVNNAAIIEGDNFHRFTRPEMELEIRKAQEQGKHISYFGPVANDFVLLEKVI